MVFQLGEDDFMIDGIKPFRKIKKDIFSLLMLVNCRRDLFKSVKKTYCVSKM